MKLFFTIMFLYCTHHGTNFHSLEKQIFSSLGHTKIDKLISENLGTSEMSLTSSDSPRFQGSVSIRVARMTNI